MESTSFQLPRVLGAQRDGVPSGNLQFRWMPIRSDRTRLTFAVERPGTSADVRVRGSSELQGISPSSTCRISLRRARIRSWGYVQLAGIFRKISWVDLNKERYPRLER